MRGFLLVLCVAILVRNPFFPQVISVVYPKFDWINCNKTSIFLNSETYKASVLLVSILRKI